MIHFRLHIERKPIQTRCYHRPLSTTAVVLPGYRLILEPFPLPVFFLFFFFLNIYFNWSTLDYIGFHCCANMVITINMYTCQNT